MPFIRTRGFVGCALVVVWFVPNVGVASDTDGDGVDDAIDVCCNTPHGLAVDSEGRPVADFDDDCDADVADYLKLFPDPTIDVFATLQRNFSGSLPADGPCIPTNDNCANPVFIGEGTTSFSSERATTDGPDEPGACSFGGYTHLESDIWFCYTAGCDDTIVVSLCGSSYDTKVAVYDGCDCSFGEPLACDDDNCGHSRLTGSRLTFAATAGQTYLIRVGGYEGAQGNGILTIFCEGDPAHGLSTCSAGSGGCLSANGTPGCEDPDLCGLICGIDAFCCDTEWDSYCAEEAYGFSQGFTSCDPGAGDCFTGNGSPGCEVVDCCQAVCEEDPFCCLVEWDEAFCAASVPWACGLFAACVDGVGSCFIEHATPGCDNEACCNAVCAEDMPCCFETWDHFCVDRAGQTQECE